MIEPIIPESFTYLIHLTNLSKNQWTRKRVNSLLNNDEFKIEIGTFGLSTITKEEAEKQGKTGAESYYLTVKENLQNAQIVEIRVICFINFLAHRNKDKFFKLFEKLNSRSEIETLLRLYYMRNK